MQKVIMCGCLTREPEKVDGQDLCRLNIAVRNNYKNKDGNYDSEFFNLVVWNKLHETCMKYLHKGNRILITGELHNRTYEKDGVKKYLTEIIVKELEMLPSGKKQDDEVQVRPLTDKEIKDLEEGLPF
jgi:single-strand DNA-binding protein